MRRNSSSPAFSPSDPTSAANHSTFVDSTPMRFFHFGSSRSCHDFGLRGVGLEHVELEAVAARFARHALQDMRLTAAPELHRDPVAALEVGDELELVVLRQ